MKGKKVSWCKSFTNYPLMVSIYDSENCSIKTDQNSLLGVSGEGGGEFLHVKEALQNRDCRFFSAHVTLEQ